MDYNEQAVQQAIDNDKRIGAREGAAIHALLKGGHESRQGAATCPLCDQPQVAAAGYIYGVCAACARKVINDAVRARTPKRTAKQYVCLYCDHVKGSSSAAPHCDQRPQPGEYAHVWQVIRT